VPCSAWKKDDLGAWALTGTLDWTGGDMRAWAPTFQPTTPEGAIVEQKCRATQEAWTLTDRTFHECPKLGTFRTLPSSITMSGHHEKADLNNASVEIRKCP
jgi:hypothetical protein